MNILTCHKHNIPRIYIIFIRNTIRIHSPVTIITYLEHISYLSETQHEYTHLSQTYHNLNIYHIYQKHNKIRGQTGPLETHTTRTLSYQNYYFIHIQPKHLYFLLSLVAFTNVLAIRADFKTSNLN